MRSSSRWLHADIIVSPNSPSVVFILPVNFLILRNNNLLDCPGVMPSVSSEVGTVASLSSFPSSPSQDNRSLSAEAARGIPPKEASVLMLPLRLEFPPRGFFSERETPPATPAPVAGMTCRRRSRTAPRIPPQFRRVSLCIALTLHNIVFSGRYGYGSTLSPTTWYRRLVSFPPPSRGRRRLLRAPLPLWPLPLRYLPPRGR
mmetsp:Transcript_12258/g.29968  ORF Transcript_12258/g.29968 Transcript_12258/m.29968 type:complete len:202 (+) Transcript_12258:652-1257(+)